MTARLTTHIALAWSLGSAIGLGLAPQALALGLGHAQVRSALGEPFLAEIEVAELSPGEADTVKLSLASPATYRAAGLEFNAALYGLQLRLENRPGAAPVIRISNDQAFNEPFVDLLIEANWATGHLTRSFTLLVDPPKKRPPAVAPLAERAEPASTVAASPVAASPVVTKPIPLGAAPVAKPLAVEAPTPSQLTVRRGDTASSIVKSLKPPQELQGPLLIALLQKNPGAFGGGNINRLQAGTVLSLPSLEQAKAISPALASRQLQRQAEEFAAGQRPTASQTAKAPAAERVQSGPVGKAATAPAAAPVTTDQLTLSKAPAPDKAAPKAVAADEIAQQREAERQAARIAELKKNIGQLAALVPSTNKVDGSARLPDTGADKGTGTGTGTGTGNGNASASADTAATTAKPPNRVVPPEVLQAAALPAPAPVPTPTPAPEKPQSSASAPATPVAAATTGMLDRLLERPWLLPAAVLLVLVLAVVGAIRWRRSRQPPKEFDSSFMGSRTRADSFFGVSGGQQIDTRDPGPASRPASGMISMYSQSQLYPSGDADPVAEADVYLAYGRDLQAEEILKEALRLNPERIAARIKLLEIYVKRGDAKAFDASAEAVKGTSGTRSDDWARVLELARSLPESLLNKGPALGQASTSSNSSLRRNLDLDLNSVSASQRPSIAPTRAAKEPPLSMSPIAAVAPRKASVEPPVARPANKDLELQLISSRFEPSGVPTAIPPEEQYAAPPEPPAPNKPAPNKPMPDAKPGIQSEPLQFDMNALSLELDTPPAPSAQPASAQAGPLDTRLALAEQLLEIGDTEGARSLIENVASQATGAVLERAKKLLSQLG